MNFQSNNSYCNTHRGSSVFYQPSFPMQRRASHGQESMQKKSARQEPGDPHRSSRSSCGEVEINFGMNYPCDATTAAPLPAVLICSDFFLAFPLIHLSLIGRSDNIALSHVTFNSFDSAQLQIIFYSPEMSFRSSTLLFFTVMTKVFVSII